MAVMDILAKAHEGQLYGLLAGAARSDVATIKLAFERLAPLIGRRIAQKAASDDEYEHLLDAFAGGEHDWYLDSPKGLFSRAMIRDGEDILAHVYGSLGAAREDARRIGPPDGMAPDVFEKFMSLVAALVLAGMARSHADMTAPAEPQSAAALRGAEPVRKAGYIQVIIDAVIRGIAQALVKSFTRPPGRRRRVTYGRKTRRRKSRTGRRTRRQRKRSDPTLEDLLGDLIRKAIKG